MNRGKSYLMKFNKFRLIFNYLDKSLSSILKGLALLTLVVAISACGGGQSEDSIHNPVGQETDQKQLDLNASYQIGPNWGAQKIDAQYLRKRNDFLTTKMALATVRITTPWAKGTGFFLGRFNDRYLIGTSAHLLKNIPMCFAIPLYAHFEIQGKSFRCKNIIGIWPEIDFALFSIRDVFEKKDESSEPEGFLAQINPLEFDFKDPLEHTTALSTMGFGIHKNEQEELTLKEDQDCMIYSPSGVLAKVSKANQEKDQPQAMTAFAMGCDISPGDSGSAVINRESRKAIGIVWATSSPKPEKLKTDLYLNALLNGEEDSNDIWRFFSYAVSGHTIRQKLIHWTNEVERGGFGLQDRRRTVLQFLKLN